MNNRFPFLTDAGQLRWISLLLFKLCWWLLVVGQYRWQWWVAGLLLPLQLFTLASATSNRDFGKTLLRCLLLACTGLLFDQCLSWLALLQFTTETLPLWLVDLWLAFAVLLPHLQVWLARLRWWSLAIVGSVSGVASYSAGVAFDAVAFGQPAWMSLLSLALGWAGMLPLWRYLHDENYQRTQRRRKTSS